MGEREDEVIIRTKKALADEGYLEVRVYKESASGPGDYVSFLDLMVDRRLEGHANAPHPSILWFDMKCQVNYLRNILRDAEKEYTRLFNAHQGLKEMYDDLLKGK